MSELKTFFDNLNCFFTEDDQLLADIPATAHKNENGDIDEVRIYIPEYDQFIYINRQGRINLIDISEEEEKQRLKNKGKAKK